MGYESRFYIVDKTNYKSTLNSRYYAELIASFNACVLGNDFFNEIIKYPKTDCYFFDGHEEIYEDKYGDTLIEIPIKDMMKILINAMVDDDYRRFNPLLSLLMGFDLKQWNNLVVLHYGY